MSDLLVKTGWWEQPDLRKKLSDLLDKSNPGTAFHPFETGTRRPCSCPGTARVGTAPVGTGSNLAGTCPAERTTFKT